MWHKIVTRRLLLFSISLAILIWLGESLLHYLLFDPGHPFELIPQDSNELWMRIVMSVIIIVFGIYSQQQANLKLAVEQEKLRTLKATMHTVEDSVGNSLISMKYLLSDGVNRQQMTQSTQSHLLKIIDDTISQLRNISSLDTVKEKRFYENSFYLDLTGKNT